MGQLVFQATLGGQVNLVGPNTASTFNLNVPAVSSTLATLTGTETFTNKTLTTPVINGFTGDTSVVNIGSGQFYKDTTGNIGVGVTPSAWATTNGTAIQGYGWSLSTPASGGFNTLAIASNAYNSASATWNYKGSAEATMYQQFAGSHRWFTAPSGTAGNAISFTQALTLDGNGNLLVGTTSTGSSNSNSMTFQPSSQYCVFNHSSGTASGVAYHYYSYNGTAIGSITQNGTTGVLYNLTSDYRLKNDPQPLTGAKEFVMALQPKKWQWWDGSGEGVGFIAHEFMEVAKYSGNGKKDAVDENGNPVYQSIQPSSSEVMANLVSLLQEQQALINNLTERLVVLETK